jgi:type II secretory pathway pseudopilin PulG
MMSREAVSTSSQSCLRQRRLGAKQGLSTVELLVVIVILGSLAAMAALAYRGYMTYVKVTLSTNQMLTIEDRIKTDFDLTLRGVDTGLRLPGTNQPITATSSCRDFIAAMKTRLAPYRNPFDSSPLPSPIRASRISHTRKARCGLPVTSYSTTARSTAPIVPFARQPSGLPNSRFPADHDARIRIAPITTPAVAGMTRMSGMPACRRKFLSASC